MSNDDLETDLERGPEAISRALKAWRLATYERKKQEGLLYAEFRLRDPGMNSTELKHKLNASNELYPYIEAEVLAEAEYKRVEEKHLANKRRAGLRTAY